MDKDNRQSPRMPNTGIVKHAYLVLKSDKQEELLECEVVDVSQHGIRGSIKEPGEFRYNISEKLDLQVRVIFNNDRTLNLSAHIAWFEDKPESLDFGIYFKGSIW